MTAVDDAARMLTLVPWLLERPGASLAEIALAFDVTPRQVESDLHALDFCGLPGLGGGDLMEVHWFEDRVVLTLADELRRPLRPTPGEIVRLLLAAETVLAASPDPDPALGRALDKLRTAAGIHPDAVHAIVDESPWLDQLRDVLAGSTCIELDYQGRDDDAPRTRTVDPWRLELHDGRWYLHGKDVAVDEGRIFRLDRVSGVVATRHPRGPVPDELPTPSYVPEDETSVEVVVTTAARWLASALAGVAVTSDGDGLRLAFGSDALGHVAPLIARGAGAAIVHVPDELRQLVHEHAARALTAYGAG